MSYRLSKRFSIATDYDNLIYKQNGFYGTVGLPINEEINTRRVYNNNISFLVKYHLIQSRKVNVNVATGWTLGIRQSNYYEINDTPYGWSYSFRSSTFSDIRIPALIETNYSVSKIVDVQMRIKANINEQNGNTYSADLGLSLKI